ncbi:MAG: dephospho-CoA kinase [Planctomycetota bacterium]
MTPRAPRRRPASRPSSGPTLVLGVVGGIGAGKSTVARLLAGPEGVVISADAIAAEVLASPEVAARVRERFGPAALGPNGLPDRDALAALVFDPAGGEEPRRALEGWTHPLIRARIWARLLEARAAGVARVALDVPLLLENDAAHGLARECDFLVYVDVDLETRDRRARGQRDWPPGEVARREAVQMALEEKRKRADFVVANHERLEELERAVTALARRIARR